MASMIISSSKILLLFFFILSLLLSPATGPQPTYVVHHCSANNSFAANSAFQTDRAALLSSLAAASHGNTDFYNTTVSGKGDTLYGLFMCRGDVPLQVCHQCVIGATQRLTSECRFSKEAIIWYDECLIRYSNRSFFSIVDTMSQLAVLNTGSVSDRAGFLRLLFSALNETAYEAAKPARGEKKFATKEANISGFHTLYCLAQCTPDLSPQECRSCLSRVIGELNWCCEDKQGGRVLNPSCNVRYEVYPFYHTEAPTSPALILTANTTGSGEESARCPGRVGDLEDSTLKY